MNTASIKVNLQQAKALLLATTVTMSGFTGAMKDGEIKEKDKGRVINDMVSLMTVSLSIRQAVEELEREEKLAVVRAAQEAADA